MNENKKKDQAKCLLKPELTVSPTIQQILSKMLDHQFENKYSKHMERLIFGGRDSGIKV